MAEAAAAALAALMVVGGLALWNHASTKAAHPRLTPASTRAEVAHRKPVVTPIGVDDGGIIGGQDGAAWYGTQPGLSPHTLTSGAFGRLFSTRLVGDIEAQPLVADGTLLVETEDNYAYGLDPATGAIRWTDYFGAPWDPTVKGCDAGPHEGIVGTPVVMKGVEYFLDKAYASGTTGAASYYVQALTVTTGAEQPGFPRVVVGAAGNDTSVVFDATDELQRPGLVETQGVVYAAFGSSCGQEPATGWVVGINQKAKITAMWSTMSGRDASTGLGGISAPGALRSDGLGHLIVVTGPGDEPSAGPVADTSGAPPPAKLGDAVVRLNVNADGSLSAVDFFIPFDATQLDRDDGDLGSGAPVLLPSEYFSTPTYPRLALEIGKEGYLYVLDASHLGGWRQGSDGGDAVVARLGPVGGLSGDPAVWTGAGGYVYFVAGASSATAAAGGSDGHLLAWKFGIDRAGDPTFSEVGQSVDGFGYGSSSPVVTSDATRPGSAVVWVDWTPEEHSTGAQLRAYSATPDQDGKLDLLWSAPSGSASSLSTPGVAGNRVYVGDDDGVIEGFGSPVHSALSGGGLQFAATMLGSSSSATDVFRASVSLTVTGVAVDGGGFAGGATTTLPTTVSAGGSFVLPVTFHPAAAGSDAGTITVTTSVGAYVVGLEGTGVSRSAVLAVTPRMVSFEGTLIHTSVTHDVELSNQGSQPLHMTTTMPGAPFTAAGLSPEDTTLAPGASIRMAITYTPSVAGQTASELVIHTGSKSSQTLSLSGTAGGPGILSVSPEAVTYPPIVAGESESKSFTVSNTGGSALTIKTSHPPRGGSFSASTPRHQGSRLLPGKSLTETVTFAPTSAGHYSARWALGAGGTSKATYVTFRGKAS